MSRLFIVVAFSSLALLITPNLVLADKLRVVSSFSILKDFVTVVGGDDITIDVLVEAGEDVHAYRPKPKDAEKLANADLLVVNGLGFEGWINRLITASGYDGPIVEASNNVPVLIHNTAEHDHHHAHDHHDDVDPHAWQNIENAIVYVENITKALVELDPKNKPNYFQRRDDYIDELMVLHETISQKVARIDPQERKVITSHSAYAYYESAYGINFIAAQQTTGIVGVSAKSLAEIVRLIKAENIKAGFFENLSSPRLLEQISAETNCQIIGSLYSDSLSPPDGPAASYIEMMRYNLESLLSALRN